MNLRLEDANIPSPVLVQDSFSYHINSAALAIKDKQWTTLSQFAQNVFYLASHQDPHLFGEGIKIVAFLIAQKQWEPARKALKKAALFARHQPTLGYHDAVLRQALLLAEGAQKDGAVHDARKATEIVLRAPFCDPLLHQKARRLDEKTFQKSLEKDNLREAFKVCENALLTHQTDPRALVHYHYLGRVANLIDTVLQRSGHQMAREMTQTLLERSKAFPSFQEYGHQVMIFLQSEGTGTKPPLLPLPPARKNPHGLATGQGEEMRAARKEVSRLIAAHDWAAASQALLATNRRAVALIHYASLEKDRSLALALAQGALADGAIASARAAVQLVLSARIKKTKTHQAAIILDKQIPPQSTADTDAWGTFMASYTSLLFHNLPESERAKPLDSMTDILHQAATGDLADKDTLRDMAGILCMNANKATAAHNYGKAMIGWLDGTRDPLSQPHPVTEPPVAALAPFSPLLRDQRRGEVKALTRTLRAA